MAAPIGFSPSVPMDFPAPAIGTQQINSLLNTSEVMYFTAKFGLDIDPELYGQINDNDLGINQLFKEIGGVRYVKSKEYKHFEQGRSRGILRVEAGYATGSTSTTFTVETSDPDLVFSYPTQTLYDANVTRYAIPVTVGDILEAAVGSTRYFMWVTAVSSETTSAATVTAVLYNTTATNAAATFAAGLAGVDIVMTGRMDNETDIPDSGTDIRLYTYTNTTQNMSHTYNFTNDAMYQMSGFGDAKPWFIKGLMIQRDVLDAKRQMQIMVGKDITNTASSLDRTASSEGAYDFALNYGVEASAPALVLQDFTDLALSLKQNFAPMNYVMPLSAQRRAEVESVVGQSTQMINGGVIYDRSGSSKREVSYTFKRFTKILDWNIKELAALDDTNGIGNESLPYYQYMIAIPNGMVSAFDEGGSPVKTAPMRVVYQGGQYTNMNAPADGIVETIYWGAGHANAVTKSRVNEYIFTCTQGFEGINPTVYGIITG